VAFGGHDEAWRLASIYQFHPKCLQSLLEIKGGSGKVEFGGPPDGRVMGKTSCVRENLTGIGWSSIDFKASTKTVDASRFLGPRHLDLIHFLFPTSPLFHVNDRHHHLLTPLSITDPKR
jgi:hypothetical protein